MKIYLLGIIWFVFFFLNCSTVVLEKEIRLNDLYSYSSCFELIFNEFKGEIGDNIYTYISGHRFCEEGSYDFSIRDFEALGIKYNKLTEVKLTKFYEYTNTNDKIIYKVERENNNIVIFGGYSVGAPGKYSDYIEWLIIDVKTGNILNNTQTSLSKFPFVFYFDNSGKLRFINYDYDRQDDGYINVRAGNLPITVELNSYVLIKGKFNISKEDRDEYKFYCRDDKFYTNEAIWRQNK